LRRHITAYANRANPRYDLCYIDLDVFLATPAGQDPWRYATEIDHDYERNKRIRYWSHQPFSVDCGDFETI